MTNESDVMDTKSVNLDVCYRSIIKNAKDGFVVVKNEEIVFHNPSFKEMVRDNDSTLIGATLSSIVDFSPYNSLVKKMESLDRGSKSSSFKTTLSTKDGKSI